MGITKISSKGQITIPKDVRDRLNLEPGDRVLVEAVERTAVVRPLRKPSESMRGVGKKTRQKLGGVSAVELVERMRREDEEEL